MQDANHRGLEEATMGFWRAQDDLGRELRAQRPQPRRELVDGIASRIVGGRRRGAGRPARLGVAVALTAAMLAALGAFGGLSYAANGVAHAVNAAAHVVVPDKTNMPTISESSAMAQYKVAMCFHNHTINVDSHAVHALTANGATVGACSGGSFKPSEKLVVACFKGKNVSIAATSAKTDAQKETLKKLGLTLGYCKA
jgi:hypothetical protein